MTTERIKGSATFWCDGCDDVHEGDDPDFNTAFHAMKDDGWTVRHEHGVYRHYCPDCQGAVFEALD